MPELTGNVTTLSDVTLGSLVTQIASAIDNGWACQGGIFVYTRPAHEGGEFDHTGPMFGILMLR